MRAQRTAWHQFAKGFSLIELMVVVGIVGFLAAIAVPSYTSHIAKSRRADARVQLLQVAQFMERFYTANDRYDQDRAGNGVYSQIPAVLKRAPAEGTQMYTLKEPTSGQITASTYILTMQPNTGAAMASDACGSFTITEQGVKAVTGTLGRDTCWK